MRGTVSARFKVDFPGVVFDEVLKVAEEMARPCSCLLKARTMASNDNRACNPSPAILATTSLELEVFVLREPDDVAVEGGAYDLRAEMI